MRPGKADAFRTNPKLPPKSSGQAAYGSLNLSTAPRGSGVSIAWIRWYWFLHIDPFDDTRARQVNRKSAEVIGEPSSQTAPCLIRYVMVKGVWVKPPFATVGASSSSGDAMNAPAGLTSIARGSTCWSTVMYAHGFQAHPVIGLMHSGHTSAPKIAWPPPYGTMMGALGARLGTSFALPVQAAERTTKAARIAVRFKAPPRTTRTG